MYALYNPYIFPVSKLELVLHPSNSLEEPSTSIAASSGSSCSSYQAKEDGNLHPKNMETSIMGLYRLLVLRVLGFRGLGFRVLGFMDVFKGRFRV